MDKILVSMTGESKSWSRQSWVCILEKADYAFVDKGCALVLFVRQEISQQQT